MSVSNHARPTDSNELARAFLLKEPTVASFLAGNLPCALTSVNLNCAGIAHDLARAANRRELLHLRIRAGRQAQYGSHCNQNNLHGILSSITKHLTLQSTGQPPAAGYLKR